MKKKEKFNKDIEPDEIFLDSTNLSAFNTQQFEGWLEKPISKSAIYITSVFFLIIISIYLSKLWTLQVINGQSYADRSAQNSFKQIPFIPDRGNIYDSKDKLLAWNEEKDRVYVSEAGVSSLLGYLGFPSQEELDNGLVSNPKDLVGKEGMEKKFNDILRGEDGILIAEVDVKGNIQSEGILDYGKNGESLYLSLDLDLSKKLYETIGQLANEKKFQGGAGTLMNVETGEILAFASYPEYDSNVMTKRDNNKKINSYITDSKMPFLNRVISGLYLPGSILKPIFALAALNEGIISENKEIYSAGFISIPNPYSPDKPTIFKDWKAHGYVDMRKALAFSSDVYFYAIGGGYEDQKGLGIANIEKYSRLFGLGTTTGINFGKEEIGNIPSPAWKASVFNGEKWNIGNTYHSSIGQYGFQVTPIQIVRAIGAIANNGKLIEPTFLKRQKEITPYSLINISEDKFKIIKEGMRKSATEGTASGLYFPQVNVVAKTGTAEVGTLKQFVNSWVVGFFPYENPKYAFTVVMERGPVANTVGGVYVMRELFNWMIENRSEYIK